jgi:hypothetical protein
MLTVILMPITIFAAVMARNAWVAARDQRYDALMPLIEVRLKVEGDPPRTAAEFVCRLKNIGLGPAMDVRAVVAASAPDAAMVVEGGGPAVASTVVIEPGSDRDFEFVDVRLQAHKRSEESLSRARRAESRTNAQINIDRRESYKRLRDTLHPILKSAGPMILQLTFRDVYRRDFGMAVEIWPVTDEDGEISTGRITLGAVTYRFPHR